MSLLHELAPVLCSGPVAVFVPHPFLHTGYMCSAQAKPHQLDKQEEGRKLFKDVAGCEEAKVGRLWPGYEGDKVGRLWPGCEGGKAGYNSSRFWAGSYAQHCWAVVGQAAEMLRMWQVVSWPIEPHGDCLIQRGLRVYQCHETCPACL